MYLDKLQIVNYRNLSNCLFCFSKGVNTIIGENDSGKSNAIIALRMLLDDSYYLTNKILQESDFSFLLDDWRGHWIIVSGELSSISNDEKCTESISGLCLKSESNVITSGLIGLNEDYGRVTLFIRPNKTTRSNLFHANNLCEFNGLRSRITLYDYEVVYTGRSTADFLDKAIYKSIVGDFENGLCCDPNEDDTELLGYSLDIRELQSHISVITIDALRDVENELRRGRNPIRKMIESIQANITDHNIESIKNGIKDLNNVISSIDQIKAIGANINYSLDSMIGSLYSPKLKLESQLNNEIDQLAKYISLKPNDLQDINLLGLGHLNMIFIALKLVEFEVTKTREILNMMLIEEPEAHIHNHIQRTLFSNINTEDKYTQVIMTTHSVHISEVSEISRLNIMKSSNGTSVVMQPSNNLDEFGSEKLELGSISLIKAVERYLDSKRSVLMFSKGVLLVEGDGEEILIPNLIKNALGVSLDELGIGVINIGSVAFEYIAPLFSDDRIQKKCAIITDSDKQAVKDDNRFYKNEAEHSGALRKEKLDRLFGENQWVEVFCSEYTLEIDFVKYSENRRYIERIIENVYSQKSTINGHKSGLNSSEISISSTTVFTLLEKIGKGWYSTLLSDVLDSSVDIPDYVLEAIAFVSRDHLSNKTISKMIQKLLIHFKDDEVNTTLNEYNISQTDEAFRILTRTFMLKFEGHSLARFISLLN